MILLLFIASVPLSSLEYLFIPTVKAAPGDGNMLLFWDGASIPSGWTCVSCNPGEDFYQRFPRGADTYGGSGGASTHNHTTTDVLSGPNDIPASTTEPGATISDFGHAHSLSITKSNESILPPFRQLKIIRSNSNGEPATIPVGAIALFDSASLPSGWSAYSAQNGYFPYGENTTGTIGGSATHFHALTISIGTATGGTQGPRNGNQVLSASAGHTHSATGSTSTINHEPPHIQVVFGQSSTSSPPPNSMLAMWDDDQPLNWTKVSGAGGDFETRFFKGSSSYGTIAGTATHSHVNTVITTSGPSGTILSRTGSTTASGSHTHDVTISNFSEESNIPPYRDVIIAKRVPQPDVDLNSYRFFSNVDSTDVGAPLGLENTSISAPRQGKPFRLRFTLEVTSAQLGIAGKNFKVQYATRSGTCDVSFSGESYSDIETNSGAIRYYNNTTPNDGDSVTTNANDPTASGTVIAQTYEEANSFSSTSVIPIGDAGLWDIPLIDISAPASTSYCFRVIYNDGSLLQSYSVIPEIITDTGQGHMLLLWDNPSIPTGWTCVSCNPGDDLYQRFIRGSATYGSTGGSNTHVHTANASITGINGLTIESQTGAGVSTGGHTHNATLSIAPSSNLPPYRQLRIIRADTSGVPTSLPAGAITYFDATVPAGWTRYNTQDGLYIRGEDSIGTTGGSLTHTHTASGTLTDAVGDTGARTTGGTLSSALTAHTHTYSGNTTPANHEPPFIETILGKLNATANVPTNMIAMWDNPEPVSWTNLSSSGQPFYQVFAKPSVTYGSTGGSATHNHIDTTIISSGPSTTGTHRSGTASAGGAHTHSVLVSSFSSNSHLPPYIEVIFAKLGTVNTPPNIPGSLTQKRPSDDSTIVTGEYANSGQVLFEATASDPDNPDSLQLCVEVQPIATAFVGVDTSCGTAVSYTTGTVDVEVTISGLIDGTSYHWQARIKDGSGGTSSWVSYGANLETEADFIIDATDPSGNVYDGSTIGFDIEYNDGSLDTLHANWSITDAGSGIALFEYSIGTTIGSTDILSWTGNGTTDTVTASSLSLQTSVVYYFNIRASDNAGNQTIISSDGQIVSPTLSFSTSGSGGVTFDNVNASNSYTDTETTTITTSTNAYSGYEVRLRALGPLQSPVGGTINFFDGGTYASPDEWLPGDTGYGYTSSDTLVGGINLFNPLTCAGGGNPPCFAPFTTTVPGHLVADNTSTVSGSPITNEQFTITHRVTTESGKEAGTYITTLVFSASAKY